jgi:hypothetical protein
MKKSVIYNKRNGRKKTSEKHSELQYLEYNIAIKLNNQNIQYLNSAVNIIPYKQ